MSKPTARERFVEAMKVLMRLPGYQNAKEAVCDAFADADHDASCILRGNSLHAVDYCREQSRAALRRDVFGE